MRKILIAVVATALLAACSSGTSGKPKPPQPLKVHGTMTITDPTGWSGEGILDDSGQLQEQPGTACSALSGYDDIAAGAQVVITDDTGETLAITSLGAGVVDAEGGCAFTFSTEVPAGHGFYGVTVTHRGTVKEPEARMGDISLTLGT